MKSINKINGAIASNQTIQFYLNVSQDRYNWRSRYFDFGGGKMSPIGNYIYGQAEREKCRAAGIKDNYNYSRDNRTEHIEFGQYRNIQASIFVRLTLRGIIAEISVNGMGDVIPKSSRFLVRSNDTFQNLDLKKFFFSWLRKFMYPNGFFSLIQEVYQCDKATAKEKYKEARMWLKKREEIDYNKAVKQWAKKTHNLHITDWQFGLPKGIENAVKKAGPQKRRKNIASAPSFFELADLYSAEYDTEDNMEGWLDNYLEAEYPNTILL